MVAYNDPAESPFDPSIPDLTPETPELQHVIRDAMHAVSAQINVCVPARVSAVNSDQSVDLQPLPRILYRNATQAQDRAILPNVPVSMPMGADWGIIVPVAVGDLGLAIFADRNIDGYLAGDGTETYGPADLRLHSVCDAIFVPGLPTESQNTSEGGDLVVRNGSAQMRVLKNGKFVIENSNQELLSIVDALMSQMTALTNVLQTQYLMLGAMGTSQPLASSVAAVQNVQAQVQQLQNNLSTLRS